MASIPTITGPIWSARPSRLADAARIAGFALAVLLLELLLAHGVSEPQIARYVFLFLGLFAVALVFRFPLATAIAFLGFTDFIFYNTYFARNVGSLSIRPHEVALACLLLVAVVRPQRRTWGGATGAALGAFLAMVALSAALAVSSGRTDITEAFNQARPLGLLTFFYVIVRLFPSVEQRRVLLGGAAVLAAATGVVALFVSLGAGFGASLQDPSGQIIRAGEGFGSLQRIRLPGLSLGYALFWFVLVQAVARNRTRRLAWSLLLVGIVIDIAVSFNRNMWLGLVFGAILMAVFGGSLVRHRMAVGAAVGIAGLAALLVFGSSTTSSTVVQPIIKRGATIFTPAATEHESSLQDRARETKAAWAVAQRNLVLGVGAGSPFGVFSEQPVLSGSLVVGTARIPQMFLHNQYLYLLLIAGIPGLLAFLLFLGKPLVRSFQRSPHDPAIVACGVGIALIMVSSVVAIYFTAEDMTAALGLLAGVIIADSEGRAAEDRDSGLIA